MPDLDFVTSRLLLGVWNQGDSGSFRAEVVDAHDQDGNWVGPSAWSIPWTGSGSVGAQTIPRGDTLLLDLAHFDLKGLKQDLEGGHEADGDYWLFPSLPHSVTARYSAVREWLQLEHQYFLITVRVTRSDPPDFCDTQFKIGIKGTRPYCRELPGEAVSGRPMPTGPGDPRGLAAQSKVVEQVAPVEAEPDRATGLTPAFTDRWHHTSDGARVPALMRLTQTSIFHPGYMARQPDETPPHVKVGMLVGCQSIEPTRSGTELRAKFLAFLNSPGIRALMEALTHVEPGTSWKSLAGNGPRTLEAALTAAVNPAEGVPAASALLLLPTSGEALYGRDGRSATLVLYVEPRMADGTVPPASDLTTWAQRFSLTLAVPQAFAHFLGGDLGLATSNDPPAQVGIWLQSYQPLTVMVDVDGLQVLPGRSTSNQFIGWALAASGGKSADGTVRDLLVDLCEYRLNLDGFEGTLPEETA